jgi:hypothetical protein
MKIFNVLYLSGCLFNLWFIKSTYYKFKKAAIYNYQMLDTLFEMMPKQSYFQYHFFVHVFLSWFTILGIILRFLKFGKLY